MTTRRKVPAAIADVPLQRCIWLALFDAGHPLTARQIADELPRFGFHYPNTTAHLEPHLRALLVLRLLRRLPRKSRYAHWRYVIR